MTGQLTATMKRKGATARQLSLVWLLLFLFSSHAWGLTTSALKDQTCAGYRYGSDLICTAGEFTVAPVFSAAPGTPPFCIAGQEFNFQVDLGLSGTNADRQDVGFFVGQQGNDPQLATVGNDCSVATFPTTPLPWKDNDGDACGDFEAGGNQVTTINEIKVLCQGDSVGALNIPYVVTYWQNNGDVCTGPADVAAGAKSKCNAGVSPVSGTVAVYSGAYVDVTKQTTPDGDSQPFTFTATGPAGSKVIALTGAVLTPTTATGGIYTPATIAAATNSTTITLTDGQTARFYINALAANQTLTITEAATANWESTAESISCAAVTGTPAPTTDNVNRIITAALNTTDTAAACTITNKKRSRITLAKSVGGRVDPADQFTVSASGGGTLVGTTSATTAGAGTSASTTFWSTPATALTLTDAKAAGPTPLASYETRLTCTNAFTGPGATPDASLPNNLSTASATFTPAPGDDITCTFTNTPKLTLTKAFSAGAIGVGRMATLTYTIANPAGAPARTGGLTFTDTFPANLVIAATPNVVNSCGGTPTITATAGTGTFIVGGTGANAAAGPSTCTISVDVTSATPLSGYVNGAAQITAFSDALLNGVTNQTLNVVQATLNAAFSPTTIDQGEISTLTFTLTNGAGNPAQSGINFTDTLPATVTVAAVPNITTTCPSGTGVVTAAPGSGTIAVSGATMGNGQASCVITADVTSNTPGGPYDNTSASISGTARITNGVTTSGLTVQAKALLTKAFGAATTVVGQPATLTFTIANPAGAPARAGSIAFTDTLPVNLVVANPPAVTTTCGGTFNPISAGDTAVTFTGGSVAAGPANCTASVAVTSTVAATYTNGAGNMSGLAVLLNGVTDQGLTVFPLPNLLILKSADKGSAKPGEMITYTVQVVNTGGPATQVTLTDDMGPYTALRLNYNGTDPTPFLFVPGTSGLAFGTPEYSYDNGGSWTSTAPASGGGGAPAGYNGAVTNWKIPLNNTMNFGNPNPGFTLYYQVIVK